MTLLDLHGDKDVRVKPVATIQQTEDLQDRDPVSQSLKLVNGMDLSLSSGYLLCAITAASSQRMVWEEQGKKTNP